MERQLPDAIVTSGAVVEALTLACQASLLGPAEALLVESLHHLEGCDRVHG